MAVYLGGIFTRTQCQRTQKKLAVAFPGGELEIVNQVVHEEQVKRVEVDEGEDSYEEEPDPSLVIKSLNLWRS
jgi:hypothetical protein